MSEDDGARRRPSRRARRAAPGGTVAHSHAHAREPVNLAPAELRRVRRVLTAMVVPLLLATIVGMALLWPRGESVMGSMPIAVDGATFERATVVEITDVPGEEIVAELSTGQDAGRTVTVQSQPEDLGMGAEVGDQIRVLFVPRAAVSGSPYVFIDFVRDVPLAVLAAAYLISVALVARWRGLAAVLGLAASLAVVGVFVLPALTLGTSPLLVALVGSSAMMFGAVYVAHGISIRTTTALLGTFAGLFITTAIGFWATGAARLSGSGSEEAFQLVTTFPGISLSAMLLCGIVIAGLGALNDVTITQASAVWELHATDPTAGRRQIFGRAMRIGRDHIASTVYTLAFAYVGTSLPLLMLASIYDQSLLQFITSGEIVEEVVRTLVSSIGLVLAIPITTAIAAALVGTGRAAGAADAGVDRDDAPVEPAADPA